MSKDINPSQWAREKKTTTKQKNLQIKYSLGNRGIGRAQVQSWFHQDPKSSIFQSTHNAHSVAVFFSDKGQNSECNVWNVRRFLFGLGPKNGHLKSSFFTNDY